MTAVTQSLTHSFPSLHLFLLQVTYWTTYRLPLPLGRRACSFPPGKTLRLVDVGSVRSQPRLDVLEVPVRDCVKKLDNRVVNLAILDGIKGLQDAAASILHPASDLSSHSDAYSTRNVHPGPNKNPSPAHPNLPPDGKLRNIPKSTSNFRLNPSAARNPHPYTILSNLIALYDRLNLCGSPPTGQPVRTLTAHGSGFAVPPGYAPGAPPVGLWGHLWPGNWQVNESTPYQFHHSLDYNVMLAQERPWLRREKRHLHRLKHHSVAQRTG